MKKLAIVLLAVFIGKLGSTQDLSSIYPFKSEISGLGDPIILIPGLACDGAVWDETVAELKTMYECHVLTLGGFNEEAPINLDRGFLPIVEEGIKSYIKENMDQKPILIGHSLGGFLSMSLASKHSEMLEKVIVVDSYPFMSAAYNPEATIESVKEQAEAMKNMLINTTDKVFAQQQKLTMGAMMKDPKHIEVATEWSINSSKATVAVAMFELMTTDLRAEVAGIEVPTLVIGSWYGGKDYGMTKESVKGNFETQFGKASNVTIKMAGTAKHFIMWDESSWFLEEVLTFTNNEQ